MMINTVRQTDNENNDRQTGNGEKDIMKKRQ